LDIFAPPPAWLVLVKHNKIAFQSKTDHPRTWYTDTLCARSVRGSEM